MREKARPPWELSRRHAPWISTVEHGEAAVDESNWANHAGALFGRANGRSRQHRCKPGDYQSGEWKWLVCHDIRNTMWSSGLAG